MIVKITPLDAVFFRDGRPFSWGEETWAEGIFPPYPSPFYGAIRTMWFSEHLQEFPKANTDQDKTQRLKLKFVSLYKDYLYFPLPLDLVKEKGKDEQEIQEVFTLSLLQLENLFLTNFDFSSYLLSDKDNIENCEGFIDIFELIDYLKGEKKNFFILNKKAFLKYEPKIGIAREITRTSEEGKLYRVNMTRLKSDVSFILDIEDDGLNLPERHLLRLGAEGKAALFEQGVKKEGLDDLKNLSEEIIDTIQSTKRFKLYLATPAIFKNGWLPSSWLAGDYLAGDYYEGTRLKLISARVGKAMYIGGFAMKNKDGSHNFSPQPKRMFKAVPAGSVYYFEIENPTNDNVKKIIENFHYQNISDERKQEGFGFSLVGVIK